DHALAAADCVFVDLQGVNAIFEFVAPLHGFRRKLARLADGNEAGIQPVCQRRAEDEAAGLNGQHGIDVVVEVVLGECVNERGETGLVFGEGGDVVKKNAFFGKIRHFADQLLEVVTVLGHLYHAPSMRKVSSPGTGSASITRTSSTREARGPCLTLACSALSCCSVPMPSTSTVPSILLRTQPARPSCRASFSTNQRKPTPCTRPRTMYLLAIIDSAICFRHWPPALAPTSPA